MKSNCRVCFVSGPWQLITLAASLQHVPRNRPASLENVICLYEFQDRPDIQRLMYALAERLFPGARIVDVFGLLPPKPDDEWPLRFVDQQNDLRKRIVASRVVEVWLSHLQHYPQKLCADLYAGAALELYEEGLEPYFPVGVRHGWGRDTSRTLRYGLLWLLRGRYEAIARSLEYLDYRILARHLRRVRRQYLILESAFPSLRCHRSRRTEVVSSGHLCDAIQAAAELEEVKHISPFGELPGPHAVLLCQPFYTLQACTRVQEMSQWALVAQQLIDRGYTVWVKDHPKETMPYADEMRDVVTDSAALKTYPASIVPIELLHARAPADLYVGVNSTALFYLSLCFGVRVATVAERFKLLLASRIHLQSFIQPALDNLPSLE